jgi:hypothetical protein
MSEFWKQKYSEKSNTESHVNIFRSLEIENYLRQLFKKKGYDLQNSKLNFSNSVLTIFLSKYRSGKPVRKETKRTQKNTFWEDTIKTLNRFTHNKFHINLKVINSKCLNKKIDKNLQNMNFYRFRIPELKRLYTTLATHPASSELLSDFVTTQLRTTKRHNFFLSSLKESLTLLIKQEHSAIKGLKFLIKGRLNNAPRSQKRIIKMGKIPIMTQNINITYSESIAYTPNGTIGVKLWVASKRFQKEKIIQTQEDLVKNLLTQ